MDKIYNDVLIILQKTVSNWEALNFNIKLGVVIGIIVVLLGGLYIGLIHVDVSNTGKLLWNSRSYRYIDIKPQEDYMSLIKPEGALVSTKVVTIDNQTINISYATDPKAQEIINEIGIHRLIDPIKLAEYATKKVNSILFNKEQIVYRDIKMFFNETTEKEHAGAFVKFTTGEIFFNWSFIKNRYENMTKDDFINYYVGLYIHELAHTFGIHGSNDRLRENAAEYVRMIAGFQPSTWKVTASNKELPTELYGAEGAYFLYWIEDKYPGFIKRLVDDGFSSDENKYYQEHTGRSLKDLWKEFQGVLYVL